MRLAAEEVPEMAGVSVALLWKPEFRKQFQTFGFVLAPPGDSLSDINLQLAGAGQTLRMLEMFLGNIIQQMATVEQLAVRLNAEIGVLQQERDRLLQEIEPKSQGVASGGQSDG